MSMIGPNSRRLDHAVIHVEFTKGDVEETAPGNIEI